MEQSQAMSLNEDLLITAVHNNNPECVLRLIEQGADQAERVDIATWNVRGINSEGALEQLTTETKKYNIKILAIQETNISGEQTADIDNYVFINLGGEQNRLGTGFLIHESLKLTIISYRRISERLSYVRLRGTYRELRIINAHAPSEEEKEEVKLQHYENLEKAYEEIPKDDIKIVLGDFNAKVGRESEYKPVIGENSTHDSSNKNGKLLINFAMERDLVIRATFFTHKEIHKGTWRSPDKKAVNQTDHILIERIHAALITDVRSYRGADIDSDHFLVRAKMQQRISTKKEEWFDAECKEMVGNRIEAKMKLLAIYTEENKRSYQEASRAARKICRKKKREQLEKEIQKTQV